jgi:hypothetical protein
MELGIIMSQKGLLAVFVYLVRINKKDNPLFFKYAYQL